MIELLYFYKSILFQPVMLNWQSLIIFVINNHSFSQKIISSSMSSSKFWLSSSFFKLPSSWSLMASAYSACFLLLSNTFFNLKKFKSSILLDMKEPSYNLSAFIYNNFSFILVCVQKTVCGIFQSKLTRWLFSFPSIGFLCVNPFLIS